LTEPARIEPADWKDLRGVLYLERVCFDKDAWPWMDVLAALTFPETVRLKAVLGERLAGFVVGDRRRREGLGWIASIGVDPEFQRRGIGQSLLTAAETELGMPRVRLTLRRSNRPALDLYVKTGYRQVEVWPRYYPDGEDGLVMEKCVAAGDPAAPESSRM
jgi:ribosomal-protein-alanine N-acetyltransferase